MAFRRDDRTLDFGNASDASTLVWGDCVLDSSSISPIEKATPACDTWSRSCAPGTDKNGNLFFVVVSVSNAPYN